MRRIATAMLASLAVTAVLLVFTAFFVAVDYGVDPLVAIIGQVLLVGFTLFTLKFWDMLDK